MKVAILRTSPATVLRDYHELLNLAGYRDVLAKDAVAFQAWYPDCNATLFDVALALAPAA